MRLLILIALALSVGCDVVEPMDADNVEPENAEPVETISLYDVNIFDSWSVSTEVTASTCDGSAVGYTISEIKNLTTDSNGYIYNDGVYIPFALYADGEYSENIELNSENWNGYSMSVSFIDANTGFGASVETRFTVDPSFESLIEFNSCYIISSVEFNRV